MATKLYNLYRVRSHNRDNVPDGRELVMTGTVEEVQKEYESYSHMCRCSDRFLVANHDSPATTATGVEEWLYAVL